MEEILVFHLKNEKMLRVKILLFEEEIDIDSLLSIDYSNLLGELVTFPVVLNKLGIALADMENKVSEAKLDVDVYKAKAEETIKRDVVSKGVAKPTERALDAAIMNDKVYQAKQRNFFRVVKEKSYLNSIYWSAKDKSEKLNKLSLTIQPGDVDYDQLQGAINNVEIKLKNKLMN